MLTRNFRCAIFGTLMLAFFAGCGDDEPTVFGNDGATLNNFNLSGALALLANSDGTVVQDAKGMPYFAAKLYTLSKGGEIAELPVTFSGNANGGTNNYVLYPLNERYSILSFFTRNESYIIDQANGEVHKSVYMGQPERCVAGAKDLYFSDLYAYNTENRHRSVKVSNFLSADAEETEMPTGEYFILDQNDNLYSWTSTSVMDVSYYGNGSKTKVASGMAIYNDHENKLNVVSVDGKISSLTNGLVRDEIFLKDVSLSRQLFSTHTFPKQQKTLAVFRNENGSFHTMLYDVTFGDKKLDITTLSQNNFNFYAGSALDKYLFLLGSVNDKATIVRIDVTDYSYTQVSFDTPGSVLRADKMSAVSNTEVVVEICVPSSSYPGACSPQLLYFNMTGTVKTIFDALNSRDGVVRLSDN